MISLQNQVGRIKLQFMLQGKIVVYSKAQKALNLPLQYNYLYFLDDFELHYAKLGKMRLMDGDEAVSNLFSNYHSKLEKLDSYDEAALEIHREMHEPSSIIGIFKSLFMWKETPEERLKENSQK